MIAVDTNLLVYAHREDSPWHEAAAAIMTRRAEVGRFPDLKIRNPLVGESGPSWFHTPDTHGVNLA
jgi:hypothetical protein